MDVKMGEFFLKHEWAQLLELCDHVLAQYRAPEPVSEALKVDIKKVSSQVDILVRQFITSGNPEAAEAARFAADLFFSLDNNNEALKMLSIMEELCHKNGDFDRALECAWRRGKVLVEANVYTEDSKGALQRCLAYADQNEGKFRNLIYVDDTKKNAKYYLGKVLFTLGDFRDAIPNFMAAEHDEGFDQGSVCFHLGLSNKSAARFQPTNTEDIRKTFEAAASYYTRSFNLWKAKGDTQAISLAFRAAEEASGVFFHIKDFGQASKINKEAALLAREAENQSRESKFWWNCGQMMVAEQKYDEALAYFVASLEAALQSAGDQDEACVEQAFTWLNFMSFLTKGRNKEEFESTLKPVSLTKSSLSSVSPVERRAEAMLALGIAKHNLGQQDRGIDLLTKALAMLDETPYHGATSNRLFDISFLLAAMHEECGNWNDSATLLQRCETLVESPLKQLDCAIRKGVALAHSNYLEHSLSALSDALEHYGDLRDSFPNAFAELLCALGLSFKRCGRIEEAIQKLEEACRIWDETKAYDRIEVPQAYMGMFEALILKQEYWKAFELAKRFQPVLEQYHHEDEILLRWKALQGTGYMHIADYNLASTKYLTTALKEAKDRGHWNLQVTILGNLARSYRGLKNYDTALEMYEELEELLKRSEGYGHFLLEAETAINRAEVYYQKGVTEDKEYYNLALETYKKAKVYLASHPFTNHLQARAYAGQARVLHNLGNLAEAGEIAEKALQLVDGDRILIANLNHIQAYKLWSEDAFDKAIDVARTAALCFADVQMKLQDLESAWVTFFGNEMKHMFILLQRIYAAKEDYTKALLWAERGRMRLFQYKVESSQHDEVRDNIRGASSSTSKFSRLTLGTPSNESQAEKNIDELHLLEFNEVASAKRSGESKHITCESDHELRCLKVEVSAIVDKSDTSPVENFDNKQKVQEDSARKSGEAVPCKLDNIEVRAEDPSWFDKDDNLAENLIFETLEACGKGAAIIEYMYADAEQLLITYVLLGGANRLVHCYKTNLPDFFKKKEVSKKAKSLRSLIATTLSTIKSPKKQDKVLPYLQILHTLLLAPTSQHIVDCTRVIFVPHEVLNRIPFAALHSGGKFLIEEKCVSIVPSIRSLHHCFVKQQRYENAWKNGAVGASFVAGNPEPMGLHLDQLQGAAKEAEEVAELLGVTAITGQNMTKEAVVEGLGNGCLSVLITHGIVAPEYPHGALVLRGIESKPTIFDAFTSHALGDGPSEVRSRAGLLGGMNLQKAVTAAADVITADEIIALPKGIPAGLVVLSACETGEGEVTSEGLLDLGRAVLQAGAAAAVVSHWKVDDDSTKDLMTGLFKVLVNEGKTVAEALQSTMLSLLRLGSYKPCHWAPFVVLGSPFIKVFEPKKTTKTSTTMEVYCEKTKD